MSNKKNLLIYAHYYIPDTASTGQILRELAEGMLDKFNITIICVVPSYLGTIEDKYKTQKYYEEEINGVKVLRIRVPELDGKFIIMYSGNIGLYYDLENLMKVVERIKPGTKTTDGREVVFAFVGAGSVLDKLVLYVKQHHMDNVIFIPYQDKASLIYSLNAGDVHWCVNAKGIKPSINNQLAYFYVLHVILFASVWWELRRSDIVATMLHNLWIMPLIGLKVRGKKNRKV